MRILRTHIALLAALVLLPAGLEAQQNGQSQAPPGAREVAVEIERIEERLESIQQRALADAEIRAAHQALSEAVAAVMRRMDPELSMHKNRYADLEGEMAAAREAGDQDRVAEIFAEADLIERRYEITRDAALAQPEVAIRVQRFQSLLRAKMAELDAEAEPLIDRLTELDSRLHTMLSVRR